MKLQLLLLFTLLSLWGCNWESSKEHHIETLSWMQMIEAKNGFEVLYDSRASREIHEYYTENTIVINGSYFWKTQSGVYYPAWYWESPSHTCCVMDIWWDTRISTVPNFSDANLSHLVWVNWKNIKIFPREEFKENAWPYDFAFQAWPLVLSGNIVQDFWNSWHAHEKHERTLIGKTRQGKIYFFIFPEKVSLNEVGEKIRITFENDPITLLNLDGWPSTAYFDGTRWFREDARLPIIIRIKR